MNFAGAQIETDVLKRDDAGKIFDDAFCLKDDRIHAPFSFVS